MGEMLVSSWETYATKLANCQSDSELVSTFQQIAGETQTDLMVPATVIYGYDTRPSCPSLVKSLEDGLNAMDSKLVGAGLCSTPILHYLVRCTNTQGTEESYGEPTIEGYYKKLAKAYTILAVRFPTLFLTQFCETADVCEGSLACTERKTLTSCLDRRLCERSRSTRFEILRIASLLRHSPPNPLERRRFNSWSTQLELWSRLRQNSTTFTSRRFPHP